MPVKLIIFDLDGTLVDSRDMHYSTLNSALNQVAPHCWISYNEHLSTYDGLPTSKKLELLTKNKGLSIDLYKSIWELKQKYTHQNISLYQRDDRICSILHELKENGYIIYVASNSIWKNTCFICQKKGFLEYTDWIISNEEVKNPKPSPEMYLKCLIHSKCSPDETLIIEDSPIGKKAALSSGCHLLPVKDPSDIKLFTILDEIKNINEREKNMSEVDKELCKKTCNVIIPMAGYGSRFAQAGYTFPKPLIEVKGKPMIEVVVRNLGLDTSTAHFIFIVQKSHYEQYDLQHVLSQIAPGCDIIQVNGVTGGIATFESSHPKWSYAKLNEDGFVSEVAEKKVISHNATVGIYYYKKGSEFVKYAEQMIQKNIRVNNEFYVCPVFNEFVLDGKKIKIVEVKKMWGIGVPEDLNYFLSNYHGSV